jgi:molybdenum ABC transporter molybdate-binding protein
MHHVTRNPGRINSLWLLVLGGAATVAVLVLLLRSDFGILQPSAGPGGSGSTQRLALYCAAGLRFPVEQIARQYEEEYRIAVQIQFGGSDTLLHQIEVNKFDTGDLYLAADDWYADEARQRGLAAETIPLASQGLVIVVRKDSAKQIAGIRDLLAGDVRVGLANPDQAAIGRATKRALEQVPLDGGTLWDRLERHVTKHGVFKPTVNEVASDVKLGSVDAAIVWDATVQMPAFRDELRAIEVAELLAEMDLVSVCVLNSSRQPTAALKFARYLSARDRGLPVFEQHGLKPVDGDHWTERPEVTFFCGSVNRRAVEEIIAEFQQREDATVNTIYDGCGILTSRMQTIDGQRPEHGFPDVYMACDRYYLENVNQWFQDAVDVSDTEIVIAVPKGSTKVRALADLVQPGVRVAVGEPSQCTIGALTRRLLVHEGLYDQLKAKQNQPGEVVVEKSSSALIVPDVVTGHVDAALAYLTDVKANLDTIDVVRFDSSLNLAIQPFSIAKSSDHKHLGRRLLRKILDSPEAFEKAGFHFRPSAESAPPTSPPQKRTAASADAGTAIP